jgi:hypothetical protein
MFGKIMPLAAIAILLVCGCIESADIGIPENYYLDQKPADVDSPIELIRFATSIRPYTTGFTVPERVAFFEWYLKNRDFNVTFAHTQNFRNTGQEHTWLILRNRVGETMAIEPSYTEMKAESISPTTSDYKSYQDKFADIYELSEKTGGSQKYAWWKKRSGKDLLDENIMLYKKGQL